MRHFLEVAYMGTRYSGFQVQENARTVQGEIEAAFQVFFNSRKTKEDQEPFSLTGSSRTDAGVHALQNYFHFDWPGSFNPLWLYNLNAMLPPDIVLKNVREVAADAHSRFDALSRTYNYHIYQFKDPFLKDRAFFYPYSLDMEKLHRAAELVGAHGDFTSFSKRHTQAKTFNCEIQLSEWVQERDQLIYKVRANRFLRGMVRALTASMLKVGRGRMDLAGFEQLLNRPEPASAFFDVPPQGLWLMQVGYDFT